MGTQPFSRGSFTDTPMNVCLKSSYASEPAIVTLKPPAVVGFPKKLCCASSAESLESENSIAEAQNQTGPTLLKIKKAFTESGSDLQAVMRDPCISPGTNASKPSESILVPPPETQTDGVLSVDTQAHSFPAPQSCLANDQNITFGQIDIAALSPLHIDSVVFESGVYCSPTTKAGKGSFCAAPLNSHNSSLVGESEGEAEQGNCSRLIDALDIQSPALFRLGASSGLQSTPYKPHVELDEELGTPFTIVSATRENNAAYPEIGSKLLKEAPLSPRSPETEKRRVADHIQHFNKLTLCSPRGSRSAQVRSPLKFHRTPVRQTVRRINSLVGDSRRPGRNVKKPTSQVSGLSPQQIDVLQVEVCNSKCPIKKPPPVPPKKPSTLVRKPKASALGDVTNKVQPQTRMDDSGPDPLGTRRPPVQQLVEKDMNHYRGSPRNPLNQARLLSATKPVDL